MVCCWNFFNIFSKFWPRGNTVWPLLSFQEFEILSFQGSNKNFNLKLIYILVFKSFLNFLKNCITDNTVWPILPFQGSYINVHLTVIYFLVLKTYWKIVSGTRRFDRYSPFQGFYQGFMLIFLFQKSLRNLNHGQYGLTYIIHLENTDQFLSEAHIGNSDQDKIRFELYSLFKDST